VPTIPIRCRLTADEHPGIRVRQLAQIGRDVHERMARTWADDLLKEHFDAGAVNVFGYQPRRPSTIAKKVRLARLGIVQDGGRRLLVHTGQTRRMLLGVRAPVASGPRTATVHLNGPRYFGIRPRGNRPNLGQEVSAMSDRHERLIALAADRQFEKSLRRYPAKKST